MTSSSGEVIADVMDGPVHKQKNKKVRNTSRSREAEQAMDAHLAKMLTAIGISRMMFENLSRVDSLEESGSSTGER